MGKTKRQALSELQATGFNVGEFSYVRDIGLDVVRGVSHEGKRVKRGDKLPKYATVDLILGDGKEDNEELYEHFRYEAHEGQVHFEWISF